jgi:hypothetical protein
MLSHHARWPGKWVLEFGDLLACGTHAIQLAEVAIPVLLWVRKTRWLGALFGFGLHAGICMFARGLELFFLSMLMIYLAFLRSEDIDHLERWTRRWWKPGRERPR